MAWIKLTSRKSGGQAYYNTDNIVEIASHGGATRLAAIAASGSPISIDTMNYEVAESVEEVMRLIARAGEAVASHAGG